MIKQAVPEAPAFVGPDCAPTKALLNLYDVRVIVCDDGLQHYRLKRDAEFVGCRWSASLGQRHDASSWPL